MIIKFLLILGLAATAVLIFRGKVTAARLAFLRLGVGAALGLGAVAALFPQAVTRLANAVGVGRGTDLVLYVMVVAFLLTSAGLYRKVHALENRYVELARHFAVSEAERRLSHDRAAIREDS